MVCVPPDHLSPSPSWDHHPDVDSNDSLAFASCFIICVSIAKPYGFVLPVGEPRGFFCVLLLLIHVAFVRLIDVVARGRFHLGSLPHTTPRCEYVTTTHSTMGGHLEVCLGLGCDIRRCYKHSETCTSGVHLKVSQITAYGYLQFVRCFLAAFQSDGTRGVRPLVVHVNAPCFPSCSLHGLVPSGFLRLLAWSPPIHIK